MTLVVSKRTQRLVTIGLIVAAALILSMDLLIPGDDDSDPSPAIIVGDPGTSAADGGGATGGAATGGGDAPATSSPIEGFLPRSGEGSACREPVGVDLIPGYAATLTINGIAIAPEQMNVITNAEGEISNEQTASRTLSQFTFGPEENCPNGEIIRATNNQVQVCVYRLEDGPANCSLTSFSFDVL